MRYIAVHPRACGEHQSEWPLLANLCGSSPRLRGTQVGLELIATEFRFIPAPAGNTPFACPRTQKEPVHPRACGEHNTPSSIFLQNAGSSPRLRGTLTYPAKLSFLPRFIPAPAGNTTWCSGLHGVVAVHPRACGEHIVAMLSGSSSAGSSPRLRGTLQRMEKAVRRTPVHPRACGEHITFF